MIPENEYVVKKYLVWCWERVAASAARITEKRRRWGVRELIHFDQFSEQPAPLRFIFYFYFQWKRTHLNITMHLQSLHCTLLPLSNLSPVKLTTIFEAHHSQVHAAVRVSAEHYRPAGPIALHIRSSLFPSNAAALRASERIDKPLCQSLVKYKLNTLRLWFVMYVHHTNKSSLPVARVLNTKYSGSDIE